MYLIISIIASLNFKQVKKFFPLFISIFKRTIKSFPIPNLKIINISSRYLIHVYFTCIVPVQDNDSHESRYNITKALLPGAHHLLIAWSDITFVVKRWIVGFSGKPGLLVGPNYHNYLYETNKVIGGLRWGGPRPRKDQVLTFKGVQKGESKRQGRGIELRWRCAWSHYAAGCTRNRGSSHKSGPGPPCSRVKGSR